MKSQKQKTMLVRQAPTTLRNKIRIKSEIEATSNSPILSLKHRAFGCYSIVFLLFKN